MNEPNDLVEIEINLNMKKEGLLNETGLAAFGGQIRLMLQGMFGAGGMPPVRVRGSRSDVDLFKSALAEEGKYLLAMKKYGLDNERTYRNKSSLDRAIKNFERATGIKWPFS